MNTADAMPHFQKRFVDIGKWSRKHKKKFVLTDHAIHRFNKRCEEGLSRTEIRHVMIGELFNSNAGSKVRQMINGYLVNFNWVNSGYPVDVARHPKSGNCYVLKFNKDKIIVLTCFKDKQ